MRLKRFQDILYGTSGPVIRPACLAAFLYAIHLPAIAAKGMEEMLSAKNLVTGGRVLEQARLCRISEADLHGFDLYRDAAVLYVNRVHRSPILSVQQKSAFLEASQVERAWATGILQASTPNERQCVLIRREWLKLIDASIRSTGAILSRIDKLDEFERRLEGYSAEDIKAALRGKSISP